MINSSFSSKPSKHHNTQTVRARELKLLEIVHPQPRVTCQVSCVTCAVSGVRSFFLYFFGAQRSAGSWWRVCYQRGLPHLVNRPGVAGLFYKQLHHWLTEWLIDRVIDPFPPDLQITFPPKLKELESWNFDRMFTPHQVSHVRCQVLHVLSFFFYKVAKLVCGGSVINGAYPL